ncbi:hypothetical protein HID58_020907 [Brassica napus]|uniref:Uncharacterized protein n=1 Tax=Brassica napus TaxID=3708 RepID=A0ABQ8CUY9_BRANA|nr:hypothetical protein HID58_020907 [Brassica napus]
MTHHYSRSKKGKWKDESLPLRKSLVKIRKSNIADLIERDMFTLIARKHCLFCKSLAHEDGDCQLRSSRQHQEERRHLGISQRNTLMKIEEDKRRKDDRKHVRIQQSSHKDGAR